MQERSQRGTIGASAGTLVFRAMKQDPDGLPKVGRSSRQLGVRIDGPIPDIAVDAGGVVYPGSGGVSVARDFARHLPKHRLPASMGGDGRDPVFQSDSAEFNAGIATRTDRYPHGLLEPSAACTLEIFETSLAATRLHWELMR